MLKYSPYCLSTSPSMGLGSTDVLRLALGAHKKLIGRRYMGNNNMKRQNVLIAAYGAILLHALQTDFGCASVFIMYALNELYPWSSVVPCCRHLASFAKLG